MSLIIKNTKISVTSTLPPLADRLAALRVSGLQGLYMFEDGAVGQPYTTALDVSGLGNNAIARTTGGFVTPTQAPSPTNNYGILVPAGASFVACSAIFDTPISRTDGTTGFTQIAAYLNLSVATSSVADYGQRVIGSKGEVTGPNTVSNSPERGLGIGPRLFYASGTAYQFEETMDMTGSFISSTATSFISTYPSNTTKNRTNILALRLNPSAATVSLDLAGITGAGASIAHNQALKSGWTPVTVNDTFSFGIFGTGLTYSGIPTAQIMAIALYNLPLSDTQLAAAIANLQTVLGKRGIVV